MSVLFFFKNWQNVKSRLFIDKQFIYQLVFFVILFFMSCEGLQKNRGKELVVTYFEAAFAKNYVLLDTLLHEDFIFIGPKLSDTLNKSELIRSWKSTHQRNDIMQMHNSKVYNVSDQEILGNEQSLILHYYDARFHNSTFDKWVEFPVHVKFLIAAGKIQQAHIIMNQSDVQNQLGYQIISPDKKKD